MYSKDSLPAITKVTQGVINYMGFKPFETQVKVLSEFVWANNSKGKVNLDATLCNIKKPPGNVKILN